MTEFASIIQSPATVSREKEGHNVDSYTAQRPEPRAIRVSGSFPRPISAQPGEGQMSHVSEQAPTVQVTTVPLGIRT